MPRLQLQNRLSFGLGTVGKVQSDSDLARFGISSRASSTHSQSYLTIVRAIGIVPNIMARGSILKASRLCFHDSKFQQTRYSILQKSRRRWSSNIQMQEERISQLPDLNPQALTITNCTNPKDLIPSAELVFGHNFTDHMLSVEWTASAGWLLPRITPYQNLSLDPATCVFHYAFECFEGMKAYKNSKGQIRLFRPEKNMARFNKSCARIALPTFSPTALIELISKFSAMEERFIPASRGYSLYLRPTMIGTQPTLGVGPPGSALLFIIASPVGPYYPTGFRAVSLEATDYAVRAWPGGVGDQKLGANYAPGIVPQLAAAKRGFHQNLWVFGEEKYVTEVGTMNFFAAVRDPGTGRKTLMTAPLDGTILEGVIRDSVLDLARERLSGEGWDVQEKKFTIWELAEAAEEGRLMECFGTGTAAVVSPVRNISWQGKMINCGLKEGSEAGDVATRMKDWIEGIQYGDEEGHPWSWKI